MERIPVVIFVIAVLTGGAATGAGPQWVWGDKLTPGETIQISDGFVTLSWKDDVRTVELRHQKPDGRELILNVTGDSKTVQSGLDEGKHRFQLRAEGGEWGEILEVKSTYMERSKVVWLLVAGGIVAMAIVTAIIRGSLQGAER